MAKQSPVETILEDLLYQALETEQCSSKVLETAVSCTANPDLRKEWKQYLKETRRHELVLLRLFETFGLNPNARPHSRDIVRSVSEALVGSMKRAKATVTPEQAEIVACEAVVLAKAKDHMNWEVLSLVVKTGAHQHLFELQQAVEEVADDEDQHLHHTKVWCRESWVQALGLPPVIPPQEALHHLESEGGAHYALRAGDWVY